jgi:large subunit ribosomal protein L29
MKPKEVHDMTDDQLVSKGLELREQLFRLRFKLRLGNTEVVRQIQTSRKDLARIKTELRGRELTAADEAGTRLPRKTSREERKRRTGARVRVAERAARA